MTHKGKIFVCLAVALLLITTVPAESQEMRGTITGTVTDNTGAVLPGVAVTAAGPALIQPQVTVTAATGNYRFPSLPPGLYTLTFELPGFQTLIREEIRVQLNMTLTINAELAIAGVEETLTITGESPVVDVKSTTTGTNFTEELLEDLPNARDIWAAMAQSPGFQMQGYDVGGSHTGTQTSFYSYGYGDQNRTLLEGINVTENTSANAGYFDYGSFEEFQLGAAGNPAETHGLGAFFNLTVKSGGDEFHGDVYFDWEGEDTISDNVPPELAEPGGTLGDFKAPRAGLARGNPIQKQTDLNAGVGGYIWKEHAWFYVGYRQNDQMKYTLGYDQDPSQTTLTNYTVKGTYAINSKNQIIGFYNQREKLQAARNLSLTTPLEAAWYQTSMNKPKKIEWTSVLSETMFLDLQYSDWFNMFPLYPTQTKSASNEGLAPGRYDLATGQRAGSMSWYQERTVTKPQFSGKLSYYKDDWGGTHNFKFGTEIYRDRQQMLAFMGPTGIYYRDYEGAPNEVDISNSPVTYINDCNYIAVYAQDSWTVGDKLTLNLGARFERYSLGWPDQDMAPDRSDFFPPQTVPATHILNLVSLSPRIGFAYDITGEGKTVLKGFFGRFYTNPHVYITQNENPVGYSGFRYEFNDLNGNGVVDPGPDGTIASSPELGDFLRTWGGGGTVTVDRDMTPPYGHEVSVHIEHEVMESLSVRGSYVHKNFRNERATVDLNRYDKYTIPFTYEDAGDDNIPGTSDDQVLQLYDRPADVDENRVHTNPGRVGLPDYKGDYHTIEFALNRRFRDKWMFLSSFQHTWNNDMRSYSSSTNARNAARNGYTYYWEPNQARFGTQPSSFWNFKVAGRYVFPYDIGVSSSYRLQSGYNVVRRISVRLPNAGTTSMAAAPVNSDRAPNVGFVDLRFEKTFTVHPRWGRVTGIVDIFNLFNQSTVANYRNYSGSRFKEVIALLDPRVVRFGIRYSF